MINKITRTTLWYALKRVLSGGKQVFTSGKYWEERYAAGGNSGVGSYNRLARFKADTINTFVQDNSVTSVIEFGCGDGNQLSLLRYPRYLGFDISETAINICKNKFSGDETKTFRAMGDYRGEKAELALSLDVIFHLVEDNVFENYMETLFNASEKFVIIYASNKASLHLVQHVKNRKFTDWIDANMKDWQLLQFIQNKTRRAFGQNESMSDFYIFGL